MSIAYEEDRDTRRNPRKQRDSHHKRNREPDKKPSNARAIGIAVAVFAAILLVAGIVVTAVVANTTGSESPSDTFPPTVLFDQSGKKGGEKPTTTPSVTEIFGIKTGNALVKTPNLRVSHQLEFSGMVGHLNIQVEGSHSEQLFAVLKCPHSTKTEQPIQRANSSLRPYDPVRLQLPYHNTVGTLPGDYTLVIQTKNGVLVIPEEKIAIHPPDPKILDIQFVLDSPRNYEVYDAKIQGNYKRLGQTLESVKLLVSKQAYSLPVTLKRAFLQMDSGPQEAIGLGQSLVTKKEEWVNFPQLFPVPRANPKMQDAFNLRSDSVAIFQREEKHTMRFRLEFGDSKETVEFAKELHIK